MHELPKDLSNSLRSWRGSLSGRSPQPDDTADLEKGPEDYGENEGRKLSPKASSLALHPSTSSRSLRQMLGLGRPERQDHAGQPEDGITSGPKDPSSSSAPKPTAKRQVTIPQTPASQKVSVFHHTPKVVDPDPAADRLDDDLTPLTNEHFFELMGMNPPEANGQLPKELARRGGLYGQIRSRMRYIQWKYRVFDIFTYAFLAIQLVLSALFIVLGSIRTGNYHTAIVVLGAISTVLAGSLALMKGQGLPNRLRQMRDDLQNVMFECLELYWDVAADRPVLFKDIVKIREDYLRVIQAARRNHPDSWTAAANGIAKGVQPPQGR